MHRIQWNARTPVWCGNGCRYDNRTWTWTSLQENLKMPMHVESKEEINKWTNCGCVCVLTVQKSWMILYVYVYVYVCAHDCTLYSFRVFSGYTRQYLYCILLYFCGQFYVTDASLQVSTYTNHHIRRNTRTHRHTCHTVIQFCLYSHSDETEKKHIQAARYKNSLIQWNWIENMGEQKKIILYAHILFYFA